jgi:hypothetical protein
MQSKEERKKELRESRQWERAAVAAGGKRRKERNRPKQRYSAVRTRYSQAWSRASAQGRYQYLMLRYSRHVRDDPGKQERKRLRPGPCWSCCLFSAAVCWRL